MSRGDACPQLPVPLKGFDNPRAGEIGRAGGRSQRAERESRRGYQRPGPRGVVAVCSVWRECCPGRWRTGCLPTGTKTRSSWRSPGSRPSYAPPSCGLSTLTTTSPPTSVETTSGSPDIPTLWINGNRLAGLRRGSPADLNPKPGASSGSRSWHTCRGKRWADLSGTVVALATFQLCRRRASDANANSPQHGKGKTRTV